MVDDTNVCQPQIHRKFSVIQMFNDIVHNYHSFVHSAIESTLICNLCSMTLGNVIIRVLRIQVTPSISVWCSETFPEEGTSVYRVLLSRVAKFLKLCSYSS